MNQIGARIVYDNNSGKPLLRYNEFEHDTIQQRDTLDLRVLDLPYGYNDNEFKRVEKYTIKDGVITIQSLLPLPQHDYINELENQILELSGLI